VVCSENLLGGLAIFLSPVTLTDVSVTNNDCVGFSIGESGATWTGGVISGNGVANIENGLPASGGLSAGVGTNMQLSNFAIIGNASSGSGAGLTVWAGTVHLDNGLILGNTADGDGGGIQVSGDTWEGGGSVLASNVAIIGNTAEFGGGIEVATQGSVELTNSIVYANSADYDGGGVLDDGKLTTTSFLHCDIHGNYPDEVYGILNPAGTDGNISTDPLFLDTSDPDPAAWDLHLQTTSPLVDAGDPTLSDPDGSTSDIGAYGGPGADEFDLDWDSFPEWWQPGEYDFAVYPGQGLDCADLDPTVYPGVGC